MVSRQCWKWFVHEDRWAPFAGQWNSSDVSQEEDHDEAGWNLASTQFHLHPKTGGVDESEWEEKERVAIACNVGKLQRGPGEGRRDAGC